MSRRVMRGFDPSRLKARRERSGLSRPELARVAGIGHATLYQWETGATSPQVDLLKRVADALGAKISDIVIVPEAERLPGDWRVLAGLLQPQLGKLAEVSTTTVAQVERGQAALTEDNARKLSAALGVSESVYRAAYERARNRPAGTPA
ncbi:MULTISPECIES: helix-turn-helix transcriptional regulator [Rhodococcus]